MALTADKLINDERFCGDNLFLFFLYLPFGLMLLIMRTMMALVLWILSIILPNKSAVRQMLSTMACWTFGVYVKVKGKRDPRCSVLVANYVSCLDSLAGSHALGTISLRKWKVPPFFASTLGIRNAAQFIRKQHFAECASKPVLLQPEGGPTSGRGLLKFSDWPFPLNHKVQPVAIMVERMFTRVTVHRASDSRDKFPWSDALWFLWSPLTVCHVTLLPPEECRSEDERTHRKIADVIAQALQVEATDFTWEDITSGSRRPVPRRAPPPELTRLAKQVREVLPTVPMKDIMKDLAMTRSVDVTITNFLEGITPYTPEPAAPEPEPEPGTSQAPPKYVTPIPTGTFPKNAKERQLSFQERKAQMISDARKRYIEKHGFNVALNNC